MKKYFLFLLMVFLFYGKSFSQDYVWAKHLAGIGTSSPSNLDPGTSNCNSIVADESGNVYITGYFVDSVDFDPGPVQNYFISGGEEDIFLAKYDKDGNFIWVNVFPSVGGNYSKDIALDHDNNVIITGSIGNSADFDPGPGIHILDPDSGRFFFAKYDSNGNLIWANNFGAQGGWGPEEIATDSDNNIFITGTFYNSGDFDPGVDTMILVSQGTGVFLVKYDAAGQLVWGKSISGIGNLGSSSSIAVSKKNNIYITGYFGNTVDFDLGPADSTIVAGTTCDRYISVYDNDGNFLWARGIDVHENGGLFASRSIKVAVDDNENAIITGNFTDTVNFDHATNQILVSIAGGYSSYFVKYDSSGNCLWAKGIIGHCISTDVKTDCRQNIIIAGSIGSADFDPGPGNAMLWSTMPSASMNFFAKYDSNGNYIWVKAIGNGGYGGSTVKTVLFVDRDAQYIGGFFRQTGDFDPGPDSSKMTMSGVGWNAFFARYSDSYELSLGSDTSLCEGDTVILDVTKANVTYEWQDHSTYAIYHATSSGNYKVIISEGNCSYTDNIQIRFTSCDTSILTMPNVFTPDGDNKNDFFKPMKADNIGRYELTIYNRWGQLIFNTKNVAEGWNGKFNGVNCNEGVYFWIIDYSFKGDVNSAMKGWLTLIND